MKNKEDCEKAAEELGGKWDDHDAFGGPGCIFMDSTDRYNTDVYWNGDAATETDERYRVVCEIGELGPAYHIKF